MSIKNASQETWSVNKAAFGACIFTWRIRCKLIWVVRDAGVIARLLIKLLCVFIGRKDVVDLERERERDIEKIRWVLFVLLLLCCVNFVIFIMLMLLSILHWTDSHRTLTLVWSGCCPVIASNFWSYVAGHFAKSALLWLFSSLTNYLWYFCK